MKYLLGFTSLIAILLVVLPGPLYKYNVLELGPAFTALRWGVYVGIATLVLFLVQIIFLRKNINWAIAGVSVLMAVVAIALPVSIMSKAKTVPPIHDISTDLSTPPKFIAIAPIRANAPNPVEYSGEETAQQQREAYPQLVTQKYTQNTDAVFGVALATVKDFGWTLVNADKSQGIIEATDSTAWFGFKDDVVIRITSEDNHTLLDVRSKSRVGRSDLGKNAERINLLIEHINETL